MAVRKATDIPPDDGASSDDPKRPSPDDSTSSPQPQGQKPAKKRGKVITLPPPSFPRTQLQVAALVVAKHGPNMRWCAEEQAWFTWNGNVWEKNTDEHCSVYRWTRETIIGLIKKGADIEDDAQRKACLELAMKWQNHASIVAVMQNIKADVTAKLTDFDTHPWLLTVQNGTIDLTTGTIRESRREDYITKEAPVTFDPTATSAAWDDFVAWRCKNSPGFMAYQQRLAGSLLAGVDDDQQFNIDVGNGGNGKSKFWGAIFRTMGPYAVMVFADTIMDIGKGNSGGAARADLMILKGARMALVAEGEDGQRLAEGLVKLLTGGDIISARSPYGRCQVNFKPTHKLIMFTNHVPVIRGSDDGIWRRVHLLPSEASIEADVKAGLRQKINLDPIFDAARSAILNYLIKGCMQWRAHGVGTCYEVEQATTTYKREMDLIGNFLIDHLSDRIDTIISCKDLYESYQMWCETTGRGRTTLPKQRFEADLKKRGASIERMGHGGGHFWKGLDAILVKLRQQPEQNDPADTQPPADSGGMRCPKCTSPLSECNVTRTGPFPIFSCPTCGVQGKA